MFSKHKNITITYGCCPYRALSELCAASSSILLENIKMKLSVLFSCLSLPPAGVHPVHLVVLHLLGSEHGLVVHDAAEEEKNRIYMR